MEHKVRLRVLANSVVATPNPLPSVQPGDTVTFEVIGPSAEYEVEFHEVRRPCDPQGPFAVEPQGVAPLSGSVQADRLGRFLYNVFRVDRLPGPLGRPVRSRLKWAREMEGGGNFGGIDIEPPPSPKG